MRVFFGFIMKLAVLFSGGKDSSLALHKVLRGGHDVRFLLNIVPEVTGPHSFLFDRYTIQDKQSK